MPFRLGRSLAEQLSENDIQLLKLAQGGITLYSDTPAGRRAESLAERGYLKISMLVGGNSTGDDRIAWRLSGSGCEIAFAEGADASS